MKVCISGIEGRMGSFVYQILENRAGYQVVCGLTSSKKTYLEIPVYHSLESALGKHEIDLIIDFTEGHNAAQMLKVALNANIKVVTGTTGIEAQAIDELMKLSLAKNISFAYVPNFAKGASEIYNLLSKVSDEYRQVDIVETHHRRKKDRPSGTAIEYAKLLDIKTDNIESVRLNEVIATHEIILSNPGEKITIKHEIFQRDAFLRGFLETLDKVKVKPYLLIIGLKDFNKA